MSKILLSILLSIICSVSYAKTETDAYTAGSSVAYGKTLSGTIVPLKVDTDGSLITSGGGSSSDTLADVTARGNVTEDSIGIGTTAPTAKLEVIGDVFVGTVGNQVKSSSSGIVYTGTARPKRSFFVNVSGMFPSTTAGSGAVTKAETTTNKVNYFYSSFIGTARKNIQFTTPLPKSWDGGTVSAILYYIPEGTSGGTTITWDIQGVLIGDNTSMDTPYGTAVAVSDTIQTANFVHATPETGAITIDGVLSGEKYIQWQIYRDAEGDNNTSNAVLLGALIKFTATQETDN
jgi:hypothetical protein